MESPSSFQPTLSSIPKVYVIHENEEWVQPLWDALEIQQIPFENWFIHEGGWDLTAEPPEGIFYNRMSASSHTRGHRYAVELASPLIYWLESHGRVVVNGAHTLLTEVSKVRQYLALNQAGLKTPRTYMANNKDQLLAFAQNFGEDPFILKPNRGGKGLGVKLFHSVASLRAELDERKELESLDGIFLLQDYIKPPKSEIIRMEFIDGKFYYAVAVDTSEGFELCPADACEIDDLFCPTNSDEHIKPKFQIVENFENDDLPAIEKFLTEQKIDIAGIEYVENEHGERFIYDINTNTNYNSEAEKATGYRWRGMDRIAKFLKEKFEVAYPPTLTQAS